mmetsp:Transcript_5461/g.20418  ORF Transcript_5461/g.20418 Transcript_5461/m.20418 type:complete len:138 (-) Transcript_5461:1712-2125(-)
MDPIDASLKDLHTQKRSLQRKMQQSEQEALHRIYSHQLRRIESRIKEDEEHLRKENQKSAILALLLFASIALLVFQICGWSFLDMFDAWLRSIWNGLSSPLASSPDQTLLAPSNFQPATANVLFTQNEQDDYPEASI